MKAPSNILTIITIVLLLAASRLVKHPFNFTPVVAMSLFAGAYINKKWGMVIPIIAMMVSDVVLYATRYGWNMFDWKTTLSVYLSIASAFGIGWLIRKRISWYTTVASAVFASVIFFVITNFAVWLFFDMYAHSLSGLVQCYGMALPFFRNSLSGDVIYSGVLLGAFQSMQHWKHASPKATV